MVERLRVAIEKARSSRGPGASGASAEAGAAAAAPSAQMAEPPAAGDRDPWAELPELQLEPGALPRERIVSPDRTDPAHLAFDALRTRLLKMLRDNGWSRVVITSPTKGCGKTTIAANLAFSLARQPETASMLIDLDLRLPQLGHRLGLSEHHPIEPFLTGRMPAGEHLRRIGTNLALGLNTKSVRNSAELMQSRRVSAVLDGTWEVYRPDLVLFDMPPMLTCDDVLAFLPNVDAVLLVVGGGQTNADEVDECERLMEGHTNFLGVILNKGDGAAGSGYYGYGYGYGDS